MHDRWRTSPISGLKMHQGAAVSTTAGTNVVSGSIANRITMRGSLDGLSLGESRYRIAPVANGKGPRWKRSGPLFDEVDNVGVSLPSYPNNFLKISGGRHQRTALDGDPLASMLHRVFPQPIERSTGVQIGDIDAPNPAGPQDPKGLLNILVAWKEKGRALGEPPCLARSLRFESGPDSVQKSFGAPIAGIGRERLGIVPAGDLGAHSAMIPLPGSVLPPPSKNGGWKSLFRSPTSFTSRPSPPRSRAPGAAPGPPRRARRSSGPWPRRSSGRR